MSVDLVSGLLDAADQVVLPPDARLGGVHLLLQIGCLTLKTSCLVDDVLQDMKVICWQKLILNRVKST